MANAALSVLRQWILSRRIRSGRCVRRLGSDPLIFDLPLSAPSSYVHQYTLAQSASALSDAPFTTFPAFQSAFGQSFLSSSTVLPMPLPPEVAKGTTILPERS